MKRKLTEFAPGRGYTKQDWEDAASPPATDQDLAQARPFAGAFPDLAESIQHDTDRQPGGGTRQQISLRLDPDVIAKFKATGPGWQGRINDALREAKV